MRELLRRVLYGDPSEQRELQIWEAIEDLHRLVREAEEDGGAFMPAARSGREMLRTIGKR
jgi:hypothetical protein